MRPDRPPADRRPADLPAVDYPWSPTSSAGVLTEHGFRRSAPFEPSGKAPAHPTLGTRRLDELDQWLRSERAPGLGDRIPVLGVGSNRSAVVLGAKFAELGISKLLALTPARVSNLGVGHSAHVSLRGYLAAGPAIDPGAESELTMSWLDEPQLLALDRTEPNYERIELAIEDFPIVGLNAGHGTFWLYRSRWGLLAGPAGGYQPLVSQPTVHRRLASIGGLADLFATSSPAAVVAAPSDPAQRQRVRDALRQAGAIVPSGLGETPT